MRRVLSLLAALTVSSGVAGAQLVNLGPGAFVPSAPKITFDEVAVGTINPVYSFSGLDVLGDITVSFGPSFVGQTVTGGFPKTLTGLPSGPLTLNTGGTDVVKTVTDGAPGATSPVLSGDPIFNGPISIYFSKAVAGVSLKGGFFDAIGGVTIAAFASDGGLLGSITNSATGFEIYGLADASGANVIRGISFYITGPEPAGFQIDDVQFGTARDLVPGTTVPEPSSVILLGTGLLGLGAAYRRRRTR